MEGMRGFGVLDEMICPATGYPGALLPRGVEVTLESELDDRPDSGQWLCAAQNGAQKHSKGPLRLPRRHPAAGPASLQ